MTRESIVALIWAAKKEAMTEEQVADIILDAFKHIIIPASPYNTTPIWFDTWGSYNTASRKDNGDME